MDRPHVRPLFEPSPCDIDSQEAPITSLRSSHIRGAAEVWTPIVRCRAPFPIELFETAVEQLVHHPEYNSSLILRSEILSDVQCVQSPPGFLESRDRDSMFKQTELCSFDGYRSSRMMHRRLLPRRPGRDRSLEQTCVLYTAITQDLVESVPEEVRSEEEHTAENSEGSVLSLLVLTPFLREGEMLPYYHPAVKRLAVRYTHATLAQDTYRFGSDSGTGILVIEVVLPQCPCSPSTPASVPLQPQPPDPNSRLYRTCLALLDAVHRYGWGALTHYRKRVHHDCLIPREEYQDLYLVLRERYKHLVDTWKEATDPVKHVFEDIGIATFLILLWKATYGCSGRVPTHDSVVDTPWRNWPRPPGGFLDLGCGNGLLTHILVSEGYTGHGIDVRARQSWSHYPDTTKKALHVFSLDPTCYIDGDCMITTATKEEYLKPDVFLIGNHADELTPWVPVLATLCDAGGYLSIPCCAWGFDERFTRTSSLPFSSTLSSLAPVIGQEDPDINDVTFIESLNLGAEGSHKSQYSAYRIWLAQLSLRMGWKVECEVLRIPSTRNWGLVGRERLHHDDSGDVEVYKHRAREIIVEVVRRGVFKTRKPEGRAGGH